MSEREQHGSGANAEADGRVLDDALLSRGSQQRTTVGINRAKILIGVAVVAALLGVYAILSWTGALTTITDGPTLERYVVQLGILGPLAIIGLLATAIVLNPIPSAPIALAAGAAYGHLWGTVYVVIGAEVGALIAFAIAKLIGYEVLHRWLGKRLSLGADQPAKFLRHTTARRAIVRPVVAVDWACLTRSPPRLRRAATPSGQAIIGLITRDSSSKFDLF